MEPEAGFARLRIHLHLLPGEFAEDARPWSLPPPWSLHEGYLERDGYIRCILCSSLILLQVTQNKYNLLIFY